MEVATSFRKQLTASTDAATMNQLAEMQAWFQALEIEDHMAVTTFGQIGEWATGSVMGLLGKEMWETIFPPSVHAVGPNDVVPYQVRGLVNAQLRKLATHLADGQFTDARKRGTNTAEKAMTKVRKDTLKLRKGMNAGASTASPKTNAT